MLIKAGADVNAESMYGQTALMSAAREDNRNCIRILIKAGANVNAETARGETALMSAAMFGSVKWTKTLLKAGADVNAGQNNEGTALMKASRYNNYKCLDVLLAAGADVNSTDRKGRDALHLLLLNFYIHEAYLLKSTKRLLRAGIHINRFNTPQAKNALGIALESKTSVVNRDEEIYRALLMLLFEAGETLDGTDVEKIPEVLKFEDEKVQLKHMYREVIRKHLLKLDPHSNLFVRIPELGLPSALNKYLLFNVSLDDDDDDGDDDDDDDTGDDEDDSSDNDDDDNVENND